MAQRDVFYLICMCLRYTAAFASFCCAIVNSISTVSSFPRDGPVNVFMFILRIYGVIFALLCTGAEIELPVIMRSNELLKFWISRGMLQVFVAILTSAVGAHWSAATGEKIFFQFSVWLLLVCGFIYSIAGLVGFGEIRKTLVAEQQSEAADRRAVLMMDPRLTMVKPIPGYGAAEPPHPPPAL